MSEHFIKFYSFENFNIFENGLMSMIVGFSKTGNLICFTNEYASKRLGCSDRQVRRIVKQFIDDGYIKIFVDGRRRYIHLLNTPVMLSTIEETCEMENTTQDYQSIDTGLLVHTDRTISPTQRTISPYRQDYQSINNIDNNIDNNITTPEWANDKRFSDLIAMFPESKKVGVDEAYRRIWLFLDEKEKQLAENIIPIYIKRNKDSEHFIKKVEKYFEERFWNTDNVSLSLLNEKKKVKKQVKNIIV